MSYNDIIYLKRAKQLLLFKGMERRRGLSPTDIDGLLIGKIRGMQSYRGVAFIYFEAKVEGTQMPDGQKYCFEEICDSYYEPEFENEPWKSKHFAWVLICEHNVPVEDDIMARHLYVSDIRSSITLAWHSPNSSKVIPKFELTDGKLTLYDAIIQIENWCHEHHILIGKENE
jgi:hypothetical protein